jgi:hypothetical protein
VVVPKLWLQLRLQLWLCLSCTQWWCCVAAVLQCHTSWVCMSALRGVRQGS